MSGRKYITIRTREARELLPPEQQKQLADIIETLNAKRREKSPDKRETLFFTLNVADKYAQPALEAYIQAVDEDTENAHNAGVKEARAVAAAVRQFGIMYCPETKLPS